MRVPGVLVLAVVATLSGLLPVHAAAGPGAQAGPGVQAGPDLSTTFVSEPPTSSARGLSFVVTDTVTNSGNATAPPSTSRFYVGEPGTVLGPLLLLGTRSVPELAPGASSTGTTTVTVPDTPPRFGSKLGACADDLQEIVEPIESNCRYSQTWMRITFSKVPDLTVTAAQPPPTTVPAGGTIEVRSTTLNQGPVPTPLTTTQYFLSVLDDGVGDRRLTGGTQVPVLATGQEFTNSRSVTVPGNVLSGPYYLLACADGTAVTREASERNNCLTAGQVEVTG